MKKQNIFDLLCDDLILEVNTKIENFKKCIEDFNKCVDNNIIPFLVERHEEFGFEFDISDVELNLFNSNVKNIYDKLKLSFDRIQLS